MELEQELSHEQFLEVSKEMDKIAEGNPLWGVRHQMKDLVEDMNNHAAGYAASATRTIQWIIDRVLLDYKQYLTRLQPAPPFRVTLPVGISKDQRMIWANCDISGEDYRIKSSAYVPDETKVSLFSYEPFK